MGVVGDSGFLMEVRGVGGVEFFISREGGIESRIRMFWVFIFI